MLTLVDSSVMIAAARPAEALHDRAIGALEAHASGGLATPITILAETMSFIGARLGVELQRRFWDGFMHSGIEIVPVDAELLTPARDIDKRYADCGFGFADCTLLAACERAGTSRVLSFDSRLAVFRPASGGVFEVLP